MSVQRLWIYSYYVSKCVLFFFSRFRTLFFVVSQYESYFDRIVSDNETFQWSCRREWEEGLFFLTSISSPLKMYCVVSVTITYIIVHSYGRCCHYSFGGERFMRFRDGFNTYNIIKISCYCCDGIHRIRNRRRRNTVSME